jgi:hypothetical protein
LTCERYAKSYPMFIETQVTQFVLINNVSLINLRIIAQKTLTSILASE